MTDSLGLSAITLHNVLEREVCICNLKRKKKELIYQRVLKVNPANCCLLQKLLVAEH